MQRTLHTVLIIMIVILPGLVTLASRPATVAAAPADEPCQEDVDDEIAQLELICQALRGERTLIVQTHDDHVAALSKLGMRPWKATAALYSQLMTGPVTSELRQRVINAGRR